MREEGAGTALAVGIVAALLVVVALAGPLAVLLEARHRAAAAADSAALAAGDTALGLTTGRPCERAGQVAQEGGAALVSCRQRGGLVRVEAEVRAFGLPVRAAAVAGPAPPPGRSVSLQRTSSRPGVVAGGQDPGRCVWCAGPGPVDPAATPSVGGSR